MPLALTFADGGLKTVIYDTNSETVAALRQGQMPFMEIGAQDMLVRTLRNGMLELSDTPALLGECEFLVMIIGTPVDQHLNPSFNAIHRAINSCSSHLRNGQTLILRSTVFPGITHQVQRQLAGMGLKISVAFCPERVAQGPAW